MARFSGSSLMFDEDDIRTTTEHLPRLIRIILYAEGITNDGYLERYKHYFRGLFPDKTQKEFSQKAAADRKFLLDHRKLTWNMMRGVLIALGYDVEGVDIRVRDRLTGEVRTFSTDSTVDELKADIEKKSQIGYGSL